LKATILAARHACHRNGTRRGGPIYSPTYAANGSVLLALLAAATVPASLVAIAFALDRIERGPGVAADPRSTGREQGGRPRHGQAGHQDPGEAPPLAGALSVDGMAMRGARQDDGRAVHLLSAMIHGQRAVIAQRDVAHKTNETPR
jgi:hypothetical protein